MSAIDDRLTALGFPPRVDLDDESAELVDAYETIAPAIAAFARRGWVTAFDGLGFIEDYEPEAEPELLAEVLERAAIEARVEADDEVSFVAVEIGDGPERIFDLGAGDLADRCQALIELAAQLLAGEGIDLVEDGDETLIILAAVPRRGWEALETGERGDFRLCARRARPGARPEPGPGRLLN